MSDDPGPGRKWITIKICAEEQGSNKGRFVVYCEQYWFDSMEEAKVCAHCFKNLLNDHADGSFGAKFDEDIKLGSN